MPILVHSGYRPSVFYRRPDQTIDTFLWLNCAKRCPHAFRIPGDQENLLCDPVVLKAYPSWRHLADATERELQQFLQPLGLWRRRATSIVALAREMRRRRGRFPVSREKVEALPGVGQYIANAILLFCHGEPQPLLDVNMARVLERNFGSRNLVDIRYDPYLQALAAKALSKTDPSNLNWAILDLAGLVCLSREPLCRKCPLVSSCLFGRTKGDCGGPVRRET